MYFSLLINVKKKFQDVGYFLCSFKGHPFNLAKAARTLWCFIATVGTARTY